MAGFQQAKGVVRAFHAALDAAEDDGIAGTLARASAPDLLWRGFHPFGEISGPETVAETFWRPLKAAMGGLHRRPDIFIAGNNALDGGTSVWVASMGHLMGLFDRPWLGIPPTGKIAMLRFAEFDRVENGRIAETAFFFDLPHLMMQAGLAPFPPQTGVHLVQPGPATHDGLLYDDADPAEGAATLAAIDRMVNDLRTWQQDEPIETELARSWHDDMIWWGPAGIGATFTIARYVRQHAGPFRAGFADRVFNGHVAKIAEGAFGGFFGWPNLTLTPTGGFMGMPATGRPGDMRVIDIYRRAGDKLAENWVFIDLLHFWNMQGVDILDRMREVPRT